MARAYVCMELSEYPPGVPPLGHDQATKWKSGLICFTEYLKKNSKGNLITLKHYVLYLNFNFKDFLNQTLYVFSQIKDIKHIERDFHLVTWVMPQGWDLGELRVKSVHLSVTLSPPKPLDEIQPNLGCELLTWTGRFSQFQSISNILIQNLVCLLLSQWNLGRRLSTSKMQLSPSRFICEKDSFLWKGAKKQFQYCEKDFYNAII